MKDFIQANGGILGALLILVMFYNVMMSALAQALAMIKDKTATQLDNKAYEVVHRLAMIGEKIADLLSGNREHPSKLVLNMAPPADSKVAQEPKV